MAPSTNIYDSADPNHPSLPELDVLDDSSFEEYNYSEDESSELWDSSSSSSSSSESSSGSSTAGNSDVFGDGLRLRQDNGRTSSNMRHRKVSFFDSSDPSSSVSLPAAAAAAAAAQAQSHAQSQHKLTTPEINRIDKFQYQSSPGVIQQQQVDNKNNNHIHDKKKQQKRKRKARKYYDSKLSSSSARLRANWEPGITPGTSVQLHSVGSAITVTDYNEERYRVEHLEVPTMDDFDMQAADIDDITGTYEQEYVSKIEKASEKLEHILQNKPEWSKVRWISVNGLSFEAISIITRHFQLHRLSIEDMVDIPQRTKVDQYSSYTMCILPLVKLIKLKKEYSGSSWGFFDMFNNNKEDDTAVIAAGREQEEDHEHGHSHFHSHNSHSHKHKKKRGKSITQRVSEREMRRVLDWSNGTTSRRKLKLLEVHRPLSYRNLSVGIEQVSLFIMKDTVVSFFETSATDIESAILSRLSTEDTILRDSCDGSILLQSIIDGIVDLAYPIVTAYRRRLEEMQADILNDAKVSNVNELYLMLDELSLLKKNISPITTLVYSLKDHSKRKIGNNKQDDNNSENNEAMRMSFISENCDLYLNDVADHTMSYTDDLNIMETMISNLASMIFNMTSAQQNNSMSYLSLVSVIFLPLMFWSSYYGMNFTQFGDLDRDVSYYWKVSIIFTAVFIIIVCWQYFMRFFKSWFRWIRKGKREYIIYREMKKRKNEKAKKKQRQLLAKQKHAQQRQRANQAQQQAQQQSHKGRTTANDLV